MSRKRARFEEVAVADLPWPDNPFKCDLFGVFQERHPEFAEAESDEQQQLFATFIQGQSEPVIRDCRYHQVDAEAANNIALEALQSGRSINSLTEEVDPDVALLAQSYFLVPITWNRSRPMLIDGSHRVCALKLSEAATCVVRLT